ncbi:MAG: hypothetical protein ACSLFQ_07950, partial [Thermoanaerobaculia bacterium]
MRTCALLLLAILSLPACVEEMPKLERERRRMHETRPGVVRISSWASATIAWTADDIARVEESLRKYS